MNCFFDLDGTIIDSKKRLYELFKKLVPQATYSMEEYWGLKKNKASHQEILQTHFLFSENDFTHFDSTWHEEIEKMEWLAMDMPIKGIQPYLEDLRQQGARLFLVTARQSEENTLKQMELLGIKGLFDEIWVTGKTTDKISLIREKSQSLSSLDWIIGDTGKDVQTGKALGIRTAAVLSGFLSRESLIPYEPDIIVDDVTQLIFTSLAHGTGK